MADATAQLDVTVGGSSASSYPSLAEADHYHENHRSQNPEWAPASDEEKRRHILWAMWIIETYFRWKGNRASNTQSLSWPRYRAYGHDKRLIGYDYTTGAYGIPMQLKNAVSEMAYQLLIGNTAESTSQALTGLEVDVIKLEFDTPSAPKPVPDRVQDMLIDLGSLKSKKTGTATLVRA